MPLRGTARATLEPGKLVLQRHHLLFQSAKPLKQIEMALLQLVLRQAVQIDRRQYHARSHGPAPPNEKPPHPANARAFAPITFRATKGLCLKSFLR
jgi:hypothetical protein